jgi:hypothetical protein
MAIDTIVDGSARATDNLAQCQVTEGPVNTQVRRDAEARRGWDGSLTGNRQAWRSAEPALTPR